MRGTSLKELRKAIRKVWELGLRSRFPNYGRQCKQRSNGMLVAADLKVARFGYAILAKTIPA